MKNKFYLLLLFLMAIVMLPTSAQITFKLKSVVGQQNPSSNGLFSYGTLNNGTFQLFPYYGEDGTGNLNGISQKGWTFVLGQENYPFLAFEQLNAGEITPQPFPPFGVFTHPAVNKPTVVKLSIPNNATIISITSNVQRPTFGCGSNIGYSIITDNSTLLSRTIVSTSNSPNTYTVGTTPINAGNNVYFVIDNGDDGSNSCDDTALDVEITLDYDKIVTPALSGTLNCNSSSATFDVAFQPSGTLELYKLGNPSPISSTTISQVGNTFNGQGTFSGLDLSAGGDYYVIAKNVGQIQSDQSAVISVTPCCSNAVAPSISVNNLSLCQRNIGTLNATGCTNGTVTWSNGIIGTSTTVNIAGIYTATCKVLATPPCLDASSTASGVVTVNSLPTITVGTKSCNADLLTYSVLFTSNGVVTSSAGIVSGNSVINIPVGLDVTLIATNTAGCAISQTINSPTCYCPIIDAPVSRGNKSICQGQIIPNLTVSVGENTTADWYDANLILVASNTLSYTPTTIGTYYVQARNLQNNCVSATRTPVSLSINALPTLSAGTPTCSADLLTYSVPFTSNAVVTSSVGIVAEGIIFGISTGANVVLTATSIDGCFVTQTVNSPFCTCPTINTPVSAGDKTICAGQTIPALSVSVGSNEVTEWFDAPSGGNLLATGLSFTPSSQTSNNGLFYVQARNTTNNCTSNSRILVKLIVNSNGATPTIVASKNPLILGETSTLSISNCNGIILWNTGESTVSISVTPKASTEYSATCTASGGCIGGNGNITIEVNAPKIAVKATPNVVCVSGSTTLSMTGCPSNIIYWTSPEYGRRNEIAPVFNGIVQAVSFTGHCVTSAGEAIETIGVNIRQPQDFQIIASKNPIILGESVQLSTNGCDGVVSWQNGQASGNPITVWPTEKYTDYEAECLSPNACGGKGKITIEVKPPIITAIGKDVCWGSTASLSQTGCSTAFYWVVWKKDDFSDAQAIDNPNTYPITEPTRFRVACSTTAGEGAGDILIRAIPLPNKPEIIPNKESYFTGETVELNVLNCNGHLVWSTGEEGSMQIRVKPVRTSTYTATCKGGYDCISQSSIEVIVKTPTPKVKDLTLCYGDTLVLNSGCPNNAGLWTDNWLDIPNRTIRKEGEKIRMFASNTYGVSCEGEAGLSDMVAFSVMVKPKVDAPIIQSEKSVIIKGDSLELLANGCIETEWTNNKSFLFSEKTNKIVVKPIATTIFSARCFVDGCYSDYSNFKVSVRPKKPQITATHDTLCVGSSTTITAKNCEDGGIMKWLNSNNDTHSFSVSPQTDMTYKAVCIGLDNLISDTTAVKIKVYPIPKTPTIIASSLTIIEDERTTLTASNCEGIITWNTGKTVATVAGSSLTVSPTKNTTYSATCSVWRCVSEKAEITIKVRPKQLEITDGKETGFTLNDTLCLQKQLMLSVVTSCNGTIVWSNGQSGRSITIVGTKNEVYEVFCQNADNEKSDISTATILVKDYNITDAYIYPNPTAGKLFIQSKGCIDGVMLRLYTLRGELVYEGGGHERYLDSIVLDLFNLPSEEYVLHIIGTDGSKPVTLRKRVIKTNQ